MNSQAIGSSRQVGLVQEGSDSVSKGDQGFYWPFPRNQAHDDHLHKVTGYHQKHDHN